MCDRGDRGEYWEELHENPKAYISHSSPNRPSREPHYFGFFFPRNMLEVVRKNTVLEVLDFEKKFYG